MRKTLSCGPVFAFLAWLLTAHLPEAAYALSCTVPAGKTVEFYFDKDNEKLAICWNKVANAASYQVFSSQTDAPASKTLEAKASITGETANIPSVHFNMTWYYWVEAYNVAGTIINPPLGPVAVKSPPQIPRGLNYQIIGEKVRLMWSAKEDLHYSLKIQAGRVTLPEIPASVGYYDYFPTSEDAKYSFQVQAHGEGVDSTYSQPLDFDPHGEQLQAAITAGTQLTNLSGCSSTSSNCAGFSNALSFYSLEFTYDFDKSFNDLCLFPLVTSKLDECQGLLYVQFDSRAAAKEAGTADYVKSADAMEFDVGVASQLSIGHTTAYLQILPGFTFINDKNVKQNFVERWFVGSGLEYNNRPSIFHKSYIEIGLGSTLSMAEPYGSSKINSSLGWTHLGRLKLNGRLYLMGYKGLRAFWGGQIDMDMGSGTDEIRIQFGVEKNIDELNKFISGFTSSQPANP